MKNHKVPTLAASPARNAGLALVELMIAMVLGLVIIGAVTGIMLSNTQSFRTNKGLSQLQVGQGYQASRKHALWK